MTNKKISKNPNLLLIFVRNPLLGKVKKRLAAKIGDKKALELYNFLLKHTMEITKNLCVDKEVHYSEKIETNDFWDDSVYRKKRQVGTDLGERMEHAFRQGFEAGYKKIIIIGSDLYDLDQNDLENAFLSLEMASYVIGPATDGGYYLMGMKSLDPVVFKEKSWGGDSVLSATLKNLKNEEVALLESRNDIDVLEDVKNHPKLLQFVTLN